MNDRARRWRFGPLPLYTVTVRFLVLILAMFMAAPLGAIDPAPKPAVTVGPVLACADAGRPALCRETSLRDLKLEGPETILIRDVHVEPGALPLARPLMVWMVGMSSSEIRWNGEIIGRNGVPAATGAGETPGLFFATFTVPERLVRPGDNRVTARLSAHHLWLPVERAIHIFDVGYYETTNLPGLSSYLPALLALGALAAACVYFGAAFALDRRERGFLLLAAIAALVLLQLGAEIARTFILYSYPWHLVRVAAIAMLAGATSVLIAAYGARRFAPEQLRSIPLVTGLLSLAALLLIPWYDLKALAALLAAAGALIWSGARGMRRSVAGARWAIAAGLALIGLMAWQLTDFLDQSYYLLVAALLVALAAEQIFALRQARRGQSDESVRASLLEERLREAQGRDRFVALKDGTRVHRVSEAEMIFVKAADDYCEAHLADGRSLLVTANLAALLSRLPERFLRVHKSYAVNADHVVSAAPRAGGGRALVMSDGSEVPVGRAYREAVGEALGRSTPAATN